jgi:hypothetical protein
MAPLSLPTVAVLNTWRLGGADGSAGRELHAFLRCDFCAPPVTMPGSVEGLRRIGWRFDDFELGPHRCPVCPPATAGDRFRTSAVSESPALPNLIVIGAAKAGTTALHDYLDLHPEIAMAVDKELNFFTDPQCAEWAGEYASFFDGRSPLRGESSPWYSVDPLISGVPERIRDFVPDVKLIYLVRDPVARALADYAQYTAVWEQMPLEDAFMDLDDPRSRFTAPGLYGRQLERYLDVFPAEQILVVDQADLLAARRHTLRQVFGFVGVEEHFASARFDALINTTAARRRIGHLWRWLRGSRAVGSVKRLPPRPREMVLRPARRLMSRQPQPPPDPGPELQAGLQRAFADDVARLRELTGREFATWQV